MQKEKTTKTSHTQKQRRVCTAAPARLTALHSFVQWKLLVKRHKCSSLKYLVLGEGQQRGETFTTDGTHVVFGGAAVRLSVLTKPILREEGSGAHVALVVSFDEVRLLLSRTCYT